jgi:POT family proton-dependent oligopeptide transporter
MSRSFFGHPAGLATLFFTEMWERFSFYGMRALLILFMTAPEAQGGMGFDVATAGMIYGLYTAFVYLTSLPGGWIADQLIGQRRAVFWGGVIILAGHVSLMFHGMTPFASGLILVVIGTGLLKPNVSTMVGELYHDDERGSRRDAGFSIFYMGINIGAFLAPLVCGFLAQDDGFRAWMAQQGWDPNSSWHFGFGAAAVGMGLGLVQYLAGSASLGDAGIAPNRAGTDAELHARKQQSYKTLGLTVLAIVALVAMGRYGVFTITTDMVELIGSSIVILLPIIYFTWLVRRAEWTEIERKRIYVIGVLFIASALFWSAFEQAGSTLNLFADRFTRNEILGWSFPSAWFQSVNSFFIMSLAGAFAWLWVFLSQRGKEPSSPAKFALGLFFVGFGFFIVALAAFVSGPDGQLVSPMWLVGVYFFHTVGELCLSPVGLSTVTKLAPQRAVGQMMGVWFMATALGNFIGGQIATLFESFPLPWIFFSVFATTALMAGVLALMIKPIRALMGGVH